MAAEPLLHRVQLSLASGGRVIRNNILNTCFVPFAILQLYFLTKSPIDNDSPQNIYTHLNVLLAKKGCNLIPNFSMACYVFFKQNLNVRFPFMPVNFHSITLHILFLVSNNLSVKAMNISFISTLSI